MLQLRPICGMARVILCGGIKCKQINTMHNFTVLGLCFVVPLYCWFCWNTPDMLSSHWQCSPQCRSENSGRETDINRPVHRNSNERRALLWHEARAHVLACTAWWLVFHHSKTVNRKPHKKLQCHYECGSSSSMYCTVDECREEEITGYRLNCGNSPLLSYPLHFAPVFLGRKTT